MSEEQTSGWASLGRQRIRRFAVSVVLIFAVLFIGLRATSHDGLDRFGNPLTPDFAQFYVSGKMALAGQIGHVYEDRFFFERVNALFGLPKEADGYPFLYPPFVPWLCAPLSLFPYSVAATLDLVLGIALGVGLGWWVAIHLLRDREMAWDACWLFMASLPVIRCVLYGQNGLISLGLVWLGYCAWKAKREFLCGLIFALGAYKPQLFAGVALWVLLFGSNRTRTGLILGGSVLVALGFVGGADGQLWRGWINEISQVRDSVRTQMQMHSLWSGFELWSPLPNWLKIVRVVLWSVIGVFWMERLIRMRLSVRGKKEDVRAWIGEWALGLALVGGALLTPRFCQYDAVMLYPVMVGWWREAQKFSPAKCGLEQIGIAVVVGGFYLSDFFGRMGIPLMTVIGVIFFTRMCMKSLQLYNNSNAFNAI